MPKKAKETESHEENLLVSAAKTIGKAAGKIAAVSGVQLPAAGQPAHAQKSKGKLAPKNKARLPRRQKKARKKAGSAT